MVVIETTSETLQVSLAKPWYMHPHLVAGEGLEPPSSAYETELETTSSLTRDIFLIVITSATS